VIKNILKNNIKISFRIDSLIKIWLAKLIIVGISTSIFFNYINILSIMR
jgi:hypothetical protein